MTTDLKTPVDCLKRARELIAKPRGWTQGTSARMSNGRSVTTTDPRAVRFCLIGGLGKACGEDHDTFAAAARAVQECIFEQRGGKRFTMGVVVRDAATPLDISVSGYNDFPHRKKHQVLKVLDCAIAKGVGDGS